MVNVDTLLAEVVLLEEYVDMLHKRNKWSNTEIKVVVVGEKTWRLNKRRNEDGNTPVG